MGAESIEAEVREEYSELTGRKLTFILSLLAALLTIAFLSSFLGSASLTPGAVVRMVLSKLLPFFRSTNELALAVIWHLRLPRILMAIVVGMGLGSSGAVIQGTLKNPLASPYTLGIASAAGFGAAVALISGLGPLEGYLGVTGSAFLSALLCSFLVLSLSKMRGATSETLILAGVAMMFLFSACTSLLQYAGTAEEVSAVVFWMMGDLSKGAWEKAGVVLALLAVVLLLFMMRAWDLNALSLGDDSAMGLGVNVARVRKEELVLASLLTAGSVCFVGTIGFIGLVSPHLCRMVIGGDHRFLLPASTLSGGILLLAADTAARTILSPLILPVGALTSLLGVPFFIYLIVSRRKEYW